MLARNAPAHGFQKLKERLLKFRTSLIERRKIRVGGFQKIQMRAAISQMPKEIELDGKASHRFLGRHEKALHLSKRHAHIIFTEGRHPLQTLRDSLSQAPDGPPLLARLGK